MKKLCQELLHIPEHGKISEKIMIFRAGLTVFIMLFCLAAMGISSYAYFSCNVTSGMNSVKSAAFDVNVAVQIKDETGDFVPVVKNGYLYSVSLDAGIDYYVTLTHSESSSVKTGFMVISAENSEYCYHTQQIGKNADDTTKSVSFYLNVDHDTDVVFRSHWGTSSYYANKEDDYELYIVDGEKISILIAKEQSSETQTGTNDLEDASVTSDNVESSTNSTHDTTDSGAPSNTSEQPSSIDTTDKTESPAEADMTDSSM